MTVLQVIDAFRQAPRDVQVSGTNSPFDLCPVGVELIKKAGVAAGVDAVTLEALSCALERVAPKESGR